MRVLIVVVLAISPLISSAVHGEAARGVVVTANATRASSQGPSQYFTGPARIDPLFDAKAPSRVTGASVTFEPGARTAWHSHPLGQHLVVTTGSGWVQQQGGEKQPIEPGDVIWTPPGIKHWHGATATNAMTHIAIQEALDGRNVTWMEHVSDEQYRR